MAKIKHITDKHGEVVYPISKEGAIYDDNGVLLSSKISTFITRLVDNLANYYLKSELYTKEEIDTLIGAIQGFSYIAVSELPIASAFTMGTIYLVPSEDPQTQNVKDEYITIRSGSIGSYTYSWEQIGSTAIDLSGYVTTEDLNAELAKYTTTANLTTLLAGKQDTIADLASIRSGASLGATAYQKPNNGIPASDIAAGVIPDISGKQDVIPDLSTIRSGAAAGATAYQKPGTGIPSTDMASAVQTSLGNADTAYQKPSGGVPESDLASTVQTSLGKADTAIQPAEFNELEEEVGTIGNGAYEEAWDGDSTPVVADIPAGVVVTYSSASYTGTLAASASTVDKIYLVSDGNGNYDRYVTVENSGTYSWKKVGTTAIPLSDYATKTQVNQLNQKLYGGDEPFSVVPGQYTWVIFSDYGVSEGDILTIKNNGSSNLGVEFIDTDGTMISSQSIQGGGENDLSIPTGAVKIRMNSSTSIAVSINFHNGDIDGCVHATENQSFTDSQKSTARANIDAASVDDVSYKTTAQVNAAANFASWAYGYVKPNGTIQTASSGTWRYSDKIPIVPDTPIVINTMYCNTAVASVAAYDENDSFIAECSLSQSSSISESNPVTIQTTGKNVAYIRITVGGGYPDYSVIVTQYSGSLSIKDVVSDLKEQVDGNIGTQWNGKSWVALGTSITDTKNTLAPDGTTTGKFVPYLVALSGLVVTDKGVAGSSIGAHILYYAGHTTETETADIITIEGGVNDWAGNRPLGQVGDTVPYLVEWSSPVWNNGGSADGTFAGACYQAIKTAMENSPKALVVVITDNTGQYIASTGAHCEREYQNSLGLRQKDYTDMLIAVARYMGVPVINAGQKSMINQDNPEYLIDQIHQTELGGEQFANTIWSELKMMPLRVTE